VFRSAKAKLESRFCRLETLHSTYSFGFTNLRASSIGSSSTCSFSLGTLHCMRLVRCVQKASKGKRSFGQLDHGMEVNGGRPLANRKRCQVASFAFAFLLTVQ
jgi:hypothetical protein